MGTINPLAHDVETTWKKLLAGECGIGMVDTFSVDGIRCQIGALIKDFKPENFYIDPKINNKMDDSQKISVAAMVEAARMAKIPMHHPEDPSNVFPGFENMKPAVEDPFRMGVMLGIGVGGIKSFEEQIIVMQEKGARRVSPFTIPKMIPNLAGGWIAQTIGAMGVNTCYVTACASSTNALGEAMIAIMNDRADIIISGGFEAAACRIGYSGFSNMHAMSTRNDDPKHASRPFDKDRDGFVMGEGGAILVLEELEHAKKRGATIFAEIVGYGLTADAYHITSPEPSGKGAIRAMEEAIRMAGIKPDQIDYINAHGTSTDANDKMETNAIKTIFKDHAYKLSVSSTKSMSGHLLGGAGAFEAMVAVKSCIENKIPPTINLENPDEGMDLDYVPNKMKEKTVNYAMSNSFGFGGHNAVVIIRKFKS
jgi:beta-ketoacyl-acyl-carrier-protein synthase II